MERTTELTIETRLGQRVIDGNRVLHFPRGLAGLEAEKDYVLLQVKPDAPLLILQSVRNCHVGLLVADPYSFLTSYRVFFGEAERTLLRLRSSEDVAVLVTVSIPAGAPDKAVLNLTGPLVINHEARLGLQIPQKLHIRSRVGLQASHGPGQECARLACFPVGELRAECAAAERVPVPAHV
jgi:flagellar assembly factor FliW